MVSMSIFLTGFLNCIDIRSKNLIIFLLSVEVMFFGIDCLFIFVSFALNIFEGLIYCFVLIFLSVCESIIGLGFCIYLHKYKHSINFFDKEISEFKDA